MIGLAQQQHATIAGDVTALKIRLHTTPFTGWKIKRRLGTLCHGEASLYFLSSKLNYKGITGFAFLIHAIFGLASASDKNPHPPEIES
jgi:hypothetical protein